MSISGDYPHPVQVNGFTCKNCTDVDYARKHIDPAHPKSGPFGINARSDPTNAAAGAFKPADTRDAFITFGGRLAGNAAAGTAASGQDVPSAAAISTAQATTPGQIVNISA